MKLLPRNIGALQFGNYPTGAKIQEAKSSWNNSWETGLLKHYLLVAACFFVYLGHERVHRVDLSILLISSFGWVVIRAPHAKSLKRFEWYIFIAACIRNVSDIICTRLFTRQSTADKSLVTHGTLGHVKHQAIVHLELRNTNNAIVHQRAIAWLPSAHCTTEVHVLPEAPRVLLCRGPSGATGALPHDDTNTEREPLHYHYFVR